MYNVLTKIKYYIDKLRNKWLDKGVKIMCKGRLKVIRDILFTPISRSSIFDISIDFDEKMKKPDESLFSESVDLPEEEEDYEDSTDS